MSDFDLDLRSVEAHIEDVEEPTADTDDEERAVEDETAVTESLPSDRVVLGVLDGTTDPEEWAEAAIGGSVLVLSVEGDVNERAAGFARDVAEAGGDLVHFREFLIVAPPGLDIDTDRLG